MPDDPHSELASLDVAREGIVLLKNKDNLLPLKPGGGESIAVIGSRAQGPPPQLFGSAYVPYAHYVSELAGIQNEAGSGTTVNFIQALSLDPANSRWSTTGSGDSAVGLTGEYFDNNTLSGNPAVTRVDPEVNFDWSQTPPPVTNAASMSAVWTGSVIPQVTGDHVFKVRADGAVRLFVGGQEIINSAGQPLPNNAIPPTIALSGKLYLQADQSYPVRLEYQRVPGYIDNLGDLTGVQFSWASLVPTPDIAGYDAVVIAAGVGAAYEGEGFDGSFEMPEFQNELIANVAAVNPHTIVNVNAGGGVDVRPWIDQVAGLLYAWYPGQNGGQALGEILFGATNPSGKLPITIDRYVQDNPSYSSYPGPINDNSNPVMVYSEGVFMGYRGDERNGVTPEFPFGFGLSYTTFSYSNLSVSPSTFQGDSPVNVSFTVTNTGSVAGAETTELYVGQENPSIVRPIKELKGFQKVYLQPGQSVNVTIPLDLRSLSYFNMDAGGWDAEPGTYDISIGASSADIRLIGKAQNLSRQLVSPSASSPVPPAVVAAIKAVSSGSQ